MMMMMMIRDIGLKGRVFLHPRVDGGSAQDHIRMAPTPTIIENHGGSGWRPLFVEESRLPRGAMEESESESSKRLRVDG